MKNFDDDNNVTINCHMFNIEKIEKIVFATYDLIKNKLDSGKDNEVLKLPRNEDNQKIIEPLIKFGRIKCLKDGTTSCEECKEEECTIFFNNYTGLFSYIDGDNEQVVLVIHKKLCKILNECSNQCEVCSEDKSNIIQKYNQFFEKFASEIIVKLAEHLPFQIISPVYAYIDEINFSENIVLKLLLIYQKRNEIRSSINCILSYPHRKTINVSNLCRYDEVTWIDSDVILDILHNPHNLIADKNGCIDLDGVKYTPYQVMQYFVDESFDTLENRYIKALLGNLTEIIQESIIYINNNLIKSGSKKEELYKKISEELVNLKHDIEISLKQFFFSEVGELNLLPSYSQVLLKQAGYRELFSLDRLLRVTIIPNFVSCFEQALRLKSMDVLWELYVMIKIIEALKNIGFTIKETKWDEREDKGTDYDYASFILDKGNKEVKVLYQESIPVGKEGKITLRPDFLLECSDSKRRIVIDAKFMIKDHVPTSDLIKYLISEEYRSKQKFSHAVFAACLKNTDDKNSKVFSFTHMFNKFLHNECDSLESLIKYYLKLEEYENIKYDEEQYLGYTPIELPLI
ncbi:MAG: DUF2357 domain-containing protein [Thermofilaceae archaeon]